MAQTNPPTHPRIDATDAGHAAAALPRRALGKSGLEVSALGLGAGRIGGDDLDDRQVDRLIGVALDAGVDLIDSARSYGRSEERLGRALAGRRERVVLSTKVGYGVPGVPDWTGRCITEGIEAALGRLRSDRIDVVFLHSCPLETLERGEVVEALLAARRAGSIRLAGYSGEGAALVHAVRSGAFEVVQCSVSVVDQGALDGAVAEAAARGVAVLAKRPLGNAPWRFRQPPAADDLAEAWRRFQQMGLAAAPPDGRPWSDRFARFAAYAPGVSAILLGTASPQHLLDAARAIGSGPLPLPEVNALREPWARSGRGWEGRI